MKTVKTIIPPEEGWKEHTVYEVAVAFSENNVIHTSLFYSGFLNNDGTPGNYNQVWNPTYDCVYEIERIHYLKVVREVMPLPNQIGGKTPRDLDNP